MTIAERTQDTRKKLKLTQAKFGEFVGVDRATVSRWENGLRSPTGSAVKLIDLIRYIFKMEG